MEDGAVPGRVTLNECWTQNPNSGQTAIKVSYSQKVLGWAGMYWVEPAENEGDRPGGLDLTGAKRVTFWARSDTPGAQVRFIFGGVGYKTDIAGNTLCNRPKDSYPDSVCPKIEQLETLKTTWTKYVVDLSTVPRDLRKVVGGFGWVATQPLTFYLDDIVYEFDKLPIRADTTGVFRPSNGLLYLKNKNDTGFADIAINYGIPGDYPVVGDWDGDGTATIGIYRGGKFYLRNSNTLGFADLVFAFGQVGDQPIAGDWDGDGDDTIGIYRPSTGQFLLRNSNTEGCPIGVFT